MPTMICHQTLPDGSDNPTWLDQRKKGVTATDTAKLMTGGSWMEMWAKKTGRIDSEDLSHIERIQWGRWMEPIILQAYASERYANRPVTPSGELMQSDDHPWILATLDARTERPEHGTIPLDAKNTDKLMEYKWEDGIPESFAWQLRHQALVEGVGSASIACALGGNSLMWADLDIAPAEFDRVLSVSEEFWWFVENDIPPTPDKMDASAATRRALDATYWANPAEHIELLDPEYLELDEEYATIERQLREMKSQALKPLEDRLNTLKAKLKRAIGSRSKATLKNGTVYTLRTVEKEPYTVTPKPYNLIRRKAVKP